MPKSQEQKDKDEKGALARKRKRDVINEDPALLPAATTKKQVENKKNKKRKRDVINEDPALTAAAKTKTQDYNKEYRKSDKGKEARKKAAAKYRATPKGKEAAKKNTKSDKGKEAAKKAAAKYRATPKGKEAAKKAVAKHRATPKGKEAAKKYRKSDKGKEARKKATAKYRATPKGKEAAKKAAAKAAAAREEENDQVAKAWNEEHPGSTHPLLRRKGVDDEVHRIVGHRLESFSDYLHTDEVNGGKIGGALGLATLKEIFGLRVRAVVYVGVTGRTLRQEGTEFARRDDCVLNWTEDADENRDFRGRRRERRTLLQHQMIKKLGFYVISVYSTNDSRNAYMVESKLQKYLSSISAVRGEPRLWVRDDPGRKIEGAQKSVAGNMHRVYVTVSAEAYEKIHGENKLVITE